MRIVSEPEFNERFKGVLSDIPVSEVAAVTGPGRSGAVAAVYASHMLGVPYIPYGAKCPIVAGKRRLLIVDTARQSGRTLRKAERKYEKAEPFVRVAFEEPPRVCFWYESPKPQRYAHEVTAIECTSHGGQA